ncbi:hypothetical protein [Flaviflexus massiliensis]|uniref:hypothetical protein n=1 Tax=Flaviflexus massiliensis TaxID=1522309 RepID=UPI0006D552CC|nr:hypothetical protein [Flaviflexus massiliensis]
MIITCAAAVLVLIGCALPFIQASAYGQSETQSLFSSAFGGGGQTLAGILIIVSILLLFLGPVSAYFKPTVGQMARAGIISIVGGVVGIINILLMMFVYQTSDGNSISEEMGMLKDYGLDAGYGIGLWITIIAYIIGLVGGVLFFMNARPFEAALKQEQMQATQNAPYPGQQGQPGNYAQQPLHGQPAPGQFQAQPGQYQNPSQQQAPGHFQGQPGHQFPNQRATGQSGVSGQTPHESGWQNNQQPPHQQ